QPNVVHPDSDSAPPESHTRRRLGTLHPSHRTNNYQNWLRWDKAEGVFEGCARGSFCLLASTPGRTSLPQPLEADSDEATRFPAQWLSDHGSLSQGSQWQDTWIRVPGKVKEKYSPLAPNRERGAVTTAAEMSGSPKPQRLAQRHPPAPLKL